MEWGVGVMQAGGGARGLTTYIHVLHEPMRPSREERRTREREMEGRVALGRWINRAARGREPAALDLVHGSEGGA